MSTEFKYEIAKFIAVAICIGGLTAFVKLLTDFEWGECCVIAIILDCLLNIRMSVSKD